MTRRRKPYDPGEAEQARQDRLARKAEVERLKGQGAEVNVDKSGRIVSAYRSNVFNLLLRTRTITQNQHDAAYRLSLEWATWKGLDGRGAPDEPVDGGSGCAELITDRMINAGRVVNRILSEFEPASRRLIEAFMEATVEQDRPMQWRGIVQRETGITDAREQTRFTVDALEGLRRVYEEPRRAA